MSDVIKMARDAGLLPTTLGPEVETRHMRNKVKQLEAFAALIRADIKERCAKRCEREADNYVKDGEGDMAHGADWCAASIRAMGDEE